MCKLLDYLPYAILIEQDKGILLFNKKLLKLVEINQIKENFTEATVEKLKGISIEIGKS